MFIGKFQPAKLLQADPVQISYFNCRYLSHQKRVGARVASMHRRAASCIRKSLFPTSSTDPLRQGDESLLPLFTEPLEPPLPPINSTKSLKVAWPKPRSRASIAASSSLAAPVIYYFNFSRSRRVDFHKMMKHCCWVTTNSSGGPTPGQFVP